MKFAKIISGVLFVVCGGLGGTGLYLDMTKEEKTDYTIDYRYFIDNETVSSLPENIGSYDFTDYYCTNNVKGTWNEAEWKFVPSLTANTTCELRFVTKTYEIKTEFIGATNADSEYNGISSVKKGESLEFVVTLDEGYGYDSVTCSNNETATFNKETNTVLIGPFNNGSTCIVNFKVNEYDVKVEATNAAPGSASAKVEHGKNAELEISPSTNYTLDSVTCTNNQTAEWKDNKLTVSAVSDNTVCTLKFKLQSYKVVVKVNNGSVDAASKTIAYGKSDSFTITANEGYTLDGATVDCGNTATGTLTNSKLQVSGISGASTCTVTLPAKPIEPTEGTENQEA